VAFAEFMLLIYLARFEVIDELAQLTREMHGLQKEQAEAKKHHRKMQELYSNTQDLTGLWQNRTVPLLDLMHELNELCIDIQPGRVEAYMDGVTKKMMSIEHYVGHIALWLPTGIPLDEESEQKMWILPDHQELIAGQLKACVNYVQKNSQDRKAVTNALQDLTKFFGFVVVRVIAGYSLRNTDTGLFGDSSDPYCSMKVGDSPPQRTHTIDNSLNPRWDSDNFVFATKPQDTVVTFEVLDEDLRTSTSLGKIDINFADLEQNVWHRRVEKLVGERGAELEVDVQFATEAAQLAVDASPPEFDG